MELRRGISRHLEAAASSGAIVGKGRHEDVPSWSDGALHLRDIACPILGTGKEMKYGAIVPYIDARRQKAGIEYVSDRPRHT